MIKSVRYRPVEGATMYALQKSKKLFTLQKKQITDKNGKITTVYVKVDNATKKEVETYTGEEYERASDERVRAIAKERKIAIPPAWTNLWIADSKDAAVQAHGFDAKGRLQQIRLKEFSEQNAMQKFNRIKRMLSELPSIAEKIRSEAKKSEEAKVLMLIAGTGIRIGSERDTKAEKHAFGATTLEKRHVKIEENRAVLQFTAKKGVDYRVVVKDAEVVEMLKQKVANADNRKAKLFDVSDSNVRKFLHEKVSNEYDVKDFRTAIGTGVAQQILQTKVPKKIKTKKDYKKYEKLICTSVASQLCNTPTVAKSAYIHTYIFEDLKQRMVV